MQRIRLLVSLSVISRKPSVLALSCRQAIVLAAAMLAALSSAPVIAAPGGLPDCELNLDVAAYLRGGEDAENQAPVLEPAAAVTAAPVSPGKCGRGTELIDTMKASPIRVRFSNGSSVGFYPLLLTDKNRGEWSCNRIKLRSACVVSQRDNGDGTVDVTLKTQNVPRAAEEVHRVRADGTVQPSADSKYFVLLPRLKRNSSGSSTDRGDKILAGAGKAKCNGSPRECKAERGVYVERVALDELRRFRMPRILTADDRKGDAKALADLASSLNGDRKLVHLSIAASEVGWTPASRSVVDSPFEVVDAILGDSGPSYGIHQIDLATNGSQDVVPFRKLMPVILSDLSASQNSALQPPPGPVGDKPFQFEKPIRGWPIKLAADFYATVPAMVRRIRTPEFRATYMAQYQDFLKTSTGCMASLAARGGVFAVSKVAQLYVLDVDNQFGSGRSRKLAAYAKTLDKSNSDGAEKKMRDYLIENTKYGRTEAGAHDIGRRFNNIRSIVGAHDPAPSGNKSDCNINGLK